MVGAPRSGHAAGNERLTLADFRCERGRAVLRPESAGSTETTLLEQIKIERHAAAALHSVARSARETLGKSARWGSTVRTHF
jgi:hypothetical protein